MRYVALVVAAACGAPLAAQSPTPRPTQSPARPPLVLRPGVEVRLELTHAARRGRLPAVGHGAVEASGTDSLTLMLVRPARRRAVAWTDVVWLDTLTREHSRRRNMATGAVVVGTAYTVFAYYMARGLCERDCAMHAGDVAGIFAIGGAIGAVASLVVPRRREWARVMQDTSSSR